MHYLEGRPPKDTSGVTLTLAPRVQADSVSIVLFSTGFTIPPDTAHYDVPIGCCVDGFEALWPVAFRVHAHALGRNITLRRSPQAIRQSGEWAATAVRLSPLATTTLAAQCTQRAAATRPC